MGSSPPLPKLPNWTNAGSVAAFLMALVGYAMSFLVALNLHWSAGTLVNAVVPSVGVLVAAGATLYLVITRRRTIASILAAGGTVPLPTWTDPASVTTFLTTIIAAIFGLLTLVHPGYAEPAVVQAVLPSIGMLVAAGAQVINVVTHGVVHKAAVLAKLMESRFASIGAPLVQVQPFSDSPGPNYVLRSHLSDWFSPADLLKLQESWWTASPTPPDSPGHAGDAQALDQIGAFLGNVATPASEMLGDIAANVLQTGRAITKSDGD